MSAIKKLSDLDLELPNKLSEVERKLLEERFGQIKGILDDTCKAILEMPRDDAKRYYQLIVQKLQEADALFIGDSKVVENTRENRNTEKEEREETPNQRERPAQLDGAEFRKKGPPDFHPDDSHRPRVSPPKKVNFGELLDKLSPEEHEKAGRYLDCVKQFEGGLDDVICADCSLEALRTCIRGNDPSIKEPMAELIEAESRDPR